VNFTAANTPDCSGFPPDTMGAVGPTQFIIALNGRVRSFNKSNGATDGGINTATDVFFSSVMTPGLGGNSTSDPRIRYDRLSGRWFISMIDVPGNNAAKPNRIMIAMSDSGKIQNTTTWTFFQFQHDLVGPTPNEDTGAFADYQTLAIDANALYLGVNVFSGAKEFLDTTVYVVRKSSLLNGGPIVVTAFRGLISGGTAIFTPHGADNYDPSATEGYVIGTDRFDHSRLHLLRISDPGAMPAISESVSIPIDSYASAILVPHLGNNAGVNGYLDMVDGRLMAAHFRNGLLWTCHNVGVNNTGGTTDVTRDGVEWFAITNIPTGLTPVLSQSGTVYQSTATNSTAARSYWMGTIMVSGQGHAALGFSSAAAGEFINAATCGRLANDPPGTMQAPVLYTRSVAIYNPAGDSGSSRGRRWGDYSYTSVDPADDMTMWTIQEFCSSPNTYGVRVAKLLAPPPATPTNCTPAVLSQSVTNVSVVINGSPSTNGAGFFDPGAGFSNRLSLTVSGGGVTVNSLAYNNPATITAFLTVAGNAQAGARTITVTNPDGQSKASTNGLLTIVPGTNNNPPMLAAISNYQVFAGMTVTFTNIATDPESPPEVLTFSLGAGAATNASVNSTNGGFTWATAPAQLGTNEFTVIVTDDGSPPLSAAQSFTVTVLASNTPPQLAPIADQVIAVGMTLSLTNTATDTDSPPQVLTFNLGAGAATNASVNPTNGVFTWAPTSAQLGTNDFSVIVTDNGSPPLSATQSFAVTVLASNTPPLLAPIPDQTLHALMTLVITNTASDPNLPDQVLTFTLDAGAPGGATIGPVSGVLTWTPADSQVGTNPIAVRVTDNGCPNLSDSKTFAVAVIPRPTLEVVGVSSNSINLAWSAIAGLSYRVQFTDTVAPSNWTDLVPDVVASGQTAGNTDTAPTNNFRFYRVRVLP